MDAKEKRQDIIFWLGYLTIAAALGYYIIKTR